MNKINIAFTREADFCLLSASDLQTDTVTCAHTRESILSGAEAIDLVRSILAEPGVCAIDFEMLSDLAGLAWRAGRGRGAARREGRGEEAGREGRRARRPGAPQDPVHPERRPRERRRGGGAPARPCAQPAGDVRGPGRATLVAHNSQFETEVLLAHGVAVDVDCTLLMAKAIYLTAVAEDRPQPVSFALAELVERELGRARNDKAIRDRDWREPIDDLEIGYCRRDARDALELAQLYRARLEAEGLLGGYQIIARAILPTAAINLAGMDFEAGAHAALVETLSTEADQLERELDRICAGAITNHGSSAQIADWVMGHVLGGDDPDERLASFCARLQARAAELAADQERRARDHEGGQAKKAEALAEPVPGRGELPGRARALDPASRSSSARSASLWRRGSTPTAGCAASSRWAARSRFGTAPAGRTSSRCRREGAFRALFRAPPGRRLVVCDFSQIELRLAAIIAPDEALLAVYREGRDVHQDVAELDRPAAQLAVARASASP